MISPNVDHRLVRFEHVEKKLLHSCGARANGNAVMERRDLLRRVSPHPLLGPQCTCCQSMQVKNGNPQQRKQALRQITDKAREFGAGPLFDQILPLLMSPTLEDQERHLLV